MLKKIRILVADDDRRVLSLLDNTLTAAGYVVITANNGIEALEQAQAQEPDLLILDILMPRMDGFKTLQELRKYSFLPVIMLTSQSADISKIKGLNLGADDYLIKPFNPEELVTRLETVLRRAQSSSKNKTKDNMNIGGIIIDFNKQSVRVQDKTVPLTLIEWQLLSELAFNPGHLIQYEQLLTKVWGPEYRNDLKLLRTWISRIRHKLERDSGNPLIRTVRNTGYIMDWNPSSESGS